MIKIKLNVELFYVNIYTTFNDESAMCVNNVNFFMHYIRLSEILKINLVCLNIQFTN